MVPMKTSTMEKASNVAVSLSDVSNLTIFSMNIGCVLSG